jgi:hypothetical protein
MLIPLIVLFLALAVGLSFAPRVFKDLADEIRSIYAAGDEK